MKIAIFSEVYWPMVSGVSLTLQRLASAMADRGHQVRVYAPEYPTSAEYPSGIVVHRSPSRPLFLYPDVAWAFPRAAEIRADFDQFMPDLVHVATEFAMGNQGLQLAKRHQIPVVASAHTDYERYAAGYNLDWLMPAGWAYLRHFYSQARRVLAPSYIYAAHLNSRGVPHTGVWSRGVQENRFVDSVHESSFRQELGLAEGTPVVLNVGRLAVEKNLPLLLTAWERLGDRRSGAKLVLVGDGPLRESLREAGHQDVILAGVRIGDALAKAYAGSDIFAFPSSTETFGNVLLEAMAGGLPSLAVRAGGVLDFAEHGCNAWLVEPDNVDELGEGLARLLQDAALRRHLRLGALATAAQRSWSSVFERLEGDYERILLGQPRSEAA